MAKAKKVENDETTRKPLVWLHGELKTPPFTAEARQESGMFLRLLQEGERLKQYDATVKAAKKKSSLE